MHVLNWHINLGEKTGGACILAKKLFSAQVTYLNMKKTIMEVLFKIFQFQIICSFPLNVYAFFFCNWSAVAATFSSIQLDTFTIKLHYS